VQTRPVKLSDSCVLLLHSRRAVLHRESLQHCRVARWVASAASTERFQKFTTFLEVHNFLEQAYLLLDSVAVTPPLSWRPAGLASRSRRPPARLCQGCEAGAGACPPNAWGEPLAMGSRRGAGSANPVFNIQGLIEFKLSQVWHPDTEMSL